MSESHRISFQLQGSKSGTLSEQYNDYSPCSTRDGRYLLDQLKLQGERQFASQSDQRKLSTAIEEAKGWVSLSSNMDSSGQSRTVATFTSDEGIRCRIDVHIHAGSGHFSK